MKTIQEKIERMDLTMARRPKGNYETMKLILIRSPQLLFYKMKSKMKIKT